jgi:uncharacterized protein (TIGR02996 family)
MSAELGRALVEAIVEAPDDDGPRLVYADWLEENGEPERAEFIRVQCELARLPEEDARREALDASSKALEKAHGMTWIQPLKKTLDRPRSRQLNRWTFRRGFLDKLSLTLERPGFGRDAGEALSCHPVREVSFHCQPPLDLGSALEELADSSCLRALQSLSTYGGGAPTAEGLSRLGRASGLGRLTSLRFVMNVPVAALAALAGSPLAARLTDLSLFVAPEEGPALLGLLAGSPFLPALADLGVPGWPLGNEGVARLANSPNLPSIRSLWLGGPSLTAALPVVLRASPLWGRLTSLYLDNSGLGDDGAGRLAEALPESRLRRLWLSLSGITPAGARALAAAPSWGELEELSLARNPLGDEGVIALVRSPHLARLRRLEVASCGLGEIGARALAESPHAGGLRQVGVYEPDLPRGALLALRKRFGKGLRASP